MSEFDIKGNTPETISRDRIIERTSMIGIIANVLLAVFKAVIGFLSSSLPIVLDAVNNISDAGSSLITIIGIKLASREADRKHPFGYGRIEYISALLISVIILFAGFTSFRESIEKILHKEEASYSALMLFIIAVCIVVKILLGRYFVRKGQQVHSDSLINSGKDATMDSVITAGTLIAALIYLFTEVSLEAYFSLVISVVIIKSGIEMISDTLSQILGESADPSLARQIKKTISSFEDVRGAYDLVLNNYGPDRYTGSVHIEVSDQLNANQIDKIERMITDCIATQYNVFLTGISVYSTNENNENYRLIRSKLNRIVFKNRHVLQLHGLYIENDMIRFDVVMSLDANNRADEFRKIKDEVQKEFPDKQIIMVMDTDFAEA